MTTKKTDEDLCAPKATGPEIKGADRSDPAVLALLDQYPKAREIEKLASGNFAVRFRGKKPTVYKRRHKW